MGSARVHGVCLVGARAEPIEVEARFSDYERQGTEVVLSGLPDPVLRESRGRILCALEASGLGLRTGRLVLNLQPAGMKKRGEHLDLALAVAAAAAAGSLDPRWVERWLFVGELGIDGRLVDVAGGLAAADVVRERGLRALVAPPRTALEAAHLPGVRVHAANNLCDVIDALLSDFSARSGAGGTSDRNEAGAGNASGADDGETSDAATRRQLRRSSARVARISTAPIVPPVATLAPRRAAAHLAAVSGQELGKHALEVAAAGGHGLLLFGPPGAGKTLLARALVDLLPPLSLDERIELTRLVSALGEWPGGLVERRPWRAPHHTTSHVGLVGGGNPPVAGEITRAHLGVLFLDELAEFKREALEALREPLESGSVLIARAGNQCEMPARFQLVAATNPCPCGYLGHATRRCRDAPGAVRRYRERLSGPVLDRIELRVELQTPDAVVVATGRSTGLAAEGLEPASEIARVARVDRARERMRARQGETPNARLPPAELDRVASLEPAQLELLRRAAREHALSARGVQSLRRVARTLADLAGRERIATHDVAEALALRGADP